MAFNRGACPVAFAGTPEFARDALAAILSAGYPVPLVLTRPDQHAGRGQRLTPSPVKVLAQEKSISVWQPESLRLGRPGAADSLAALRASGAQVLIVAAYGLILPAAVLGVCPKGALNIHASLLPRWRGAAPIQRAIEAGDIQSGVTIMQMDEGLDTGDMLLKRAVPISETTNGGNLHDTLAFLGAELIVEALDALFSGELLREPQPVEGVTYAKKLLKSESWIDWTLSASQISAKIRAFDPFPSACSRYRDTVLKLFAPAVHPEVQGEPGTVISADARGVLVACGGGTLLIQSLQRPGGKRLGAREFLAGFPILTGDQFTSDL